MYILLIKGKQRDLDIKSGNVFMSQVVHVQFGHGGGDSYARYTFA